MSDETRGEYVRRTLRRDWKFLAWNAGLLALGVLGIFASRLL